VDHARGTTSPTPPAPDQAGVAAVVVDAAGPHLDVRGLADAVTGRPLTADTPVHLCSMAKTLAAVVVLRLAARGELDLDADVRDLVPVEIAVPGASGPALRDLLAHRGGVVDPPGSFGPGAAPAPATRDVVAGRTGAHPGPVRVTAEPGAAFVYSDAGYCLVELAVESAAGASYAEVLHREVAAPLGLVRTAAWSGSDGVPGTPSGAAVAGIAATAAAGHRADGTRLPGVRAHYPGPAASGLWSTPREVAVLLAELVRCWSGGADAVLLDPPSVAAMLDDAGEPGVGRGVFVLGPADRPCVMTQGWGEGFQGQLRGYPHGRGGAAVLTNRDPGVPQPGSVVGRTLAEVARVRGWTR
jgi:CubicO group peptidase (beta-lactamase class C family)